MWLNLIILIVTILIGMGITLWLEGEPQSPPSGGTPTSYADQPTALEEKVPDFQFTDINGKDHDISDYRGKIVLLNFWATWCPPCVIEFPKLLSLAKLNPDIVLIALSSDTDDSKIQNFLKKNEPPPSNVVIARDDRRHITSDIFGTYKLPETTIISPSGQIVRKIVGDTDWTGAEIKDFLQTLR